MSLCFRLEQALSSFNLMFFTRQIIQVSLTLWPRKGSAAFWFNLFEDGVGDYLTRHAACPVLLGSKWGMLNEAFGAM